MSKPIILFVDDDPPVLSALERDLRPKYGDSYQIVQAGSATHAQKAIKQFKQRNDPIALFIVDERMPEMTGTELLVEANKFFPEARKVLLTAYADTETANTGINTIGLDYYFRKPRDPPEENFFPVLDDLINDWWVTVPIPYSFSGTFMDVSIPCQLTEPIRERSYHGTCRLGIQGTRVRELQLQLWLSLSIQCPTHTW